MLLMTLLKCSWQYFEYIYLILTWSAMAFRRFSHHNQQHKDFYVFENISAFARNMYDLNIFCDVVMALRHAHIDFSTSIGILPFLTQDTAFRTSLAFRWLQNGREQKEWTSSFGSFGSRHDDLYGSAVQSPACSACRDEVRAHVSYMQSCLPPKNGVCCMEHRRCTTWRDVDLNRGGRVFFFSFLLCRLLSFGLHTNTQHFFVRRADAYIESKNDSMWASSKAGVQ